MWWEGGERVYESMKKKKKSLTHYNTDREIFIMPGFEGLSPPKEKFKVIFSEAGMKISGKYLD